jgi:hypothetical protein
VTAGRQGAAAAPVDLDLMRETVNVLLDPDAVTEQLPQAATGLEAVTERLRGHLALLIPEVERAAAKQPEDNATRYRALTCIDEARRRIGAQPSSSRSDASGCARRLARVLNALCDHYQQLGSERQ